MKITFKESAPGEFELGPDELRERVELAAGAALRKMLDLRFIVPPPEEECAGHLCKARMPRGGELRLVEDLTAMLTKAYEKRLERLAEDIKEVADGVSK